MNINLINEIFPWICEGAFFIALLPQIFLNYKIKSANGISDLYLIGYFTGFFLNIFLVYGLNFPIAFKVVAPLYLLVVTILIYQKFKYSNWINNFSILKLYLTDFAILFLLVPVMFLFPHVVAHASGWILIFIWSFYQFPQVFKIYRNKSVKGFSFMLVTFVAIGDLFEFLTAIIFNLPIQVFLISINGMLFYILFVLEFWFYSKKFNMRLMLNKKK